MSGPSMLTLKISDAKLNPTPPGRSIFKPFLASVIDSSRNRTDNHNPKGGIKHAASTQPKMEGSALPYSVGSGHSATDRLGHQPDTRSEVQTISAAFSRSRGSGDTNRLR